MGGWRGRGVGFIKCTIFSTQETGSPHFYYYTSESKNISSK